jgi:tetratricopeptide (TPR) repeat protein
MNSHPATAQEIAAEYYNSGLWNDGVAILQQVIQAAPDKANISPMVYYYIGYFAEKLGDTVKAAAYRLQANLQSPEYVFPFQQEAITVLRSAIEANPEDARAPYYLGNLLYDWQPEDAIALWEKSSVLDPNFPITWRNLAQAYSHKTGEEPRAKAISYMEKAVALSNPDPTHFAELDFLYKSAGTPVEKRLALLEQNQKTILRKDEALGDLINLKIFAGKTDEAILLLKSRIFSIWEGGNAFNTGQAWSDAHLIQGLKNFEKKKYGDALTDFQTALTPPENLRAQQGRNSRQVQITYWIGCTYAALGEKDKAIQSWNEVVESASQTIRPGSGGGGRASVNNPLAHQEQRYYIALAQNKLGLTDNSEAVFRELAATSTDAMSNQSGNDDDPQFARSRRLPSRDNLAMPHFIAGLGYAGLGNITKAREEFNAALALSPDYLSAKIALNQR